MSRPVIILLEEIRSAVDRCLSRLKSEESLKTESVPDAMSPVQAELLKTLASLGYIVTQPEQGTFAVHCPSVPLQVIGRWHPEVTLSEKQ